jgi:glycosyltransferase involved in cell wall biosynthesis
MHIAYFGQTPGQGTGSPINMLRHLQRWARDGARISVVAEWGQSGECCAAEGWALYHLPHRRAWWPPFKNSDEGVRRAIRMRLWARECARMLGRPDAILTYLSYHSELLSEVAAHYARASGVPLSIIIYDDVAAFHKGPPEEIAGLVQRYRWIMQQARQLWFVSRELAEAYGFAGGEHNVLMPMPEGGTPRVSWREEFATRPVIVYAGFLYEQQYPLLGRLARTIDRAGGQLLLLTRESPPLRDLCAREPITLQPLLPTNRDALAFVGQRAAGFLAAYCERVEDMPWIRSSYPSKVVEFAHLGLPILFVAPPESAIHRWNAERGVPCNLLPTDEAGVADFVHALKQRESWERLAQSTRRLAETDFSPDYIQRRMTERLR